MSKDREQEKKTKKLKQSKQNQRGEAKNKQHLKETCLIS